MKDSSVWTLAVLLLFVTIVLPSLNVVANDQTETITVDNESLTVNYSVDSQLDPPHEALSYGPNATVYNSSDVALTNGTDYVYRPSNGTVDWIDTAETTEGETASITYNVTVRSERSRDVSGIMAILAQVLPWLVLFAGAGVAFRYGGWG